MLSEIQKRNRQQRYAELQRTITEMSAENYKGRKRWKMELPMLLAKVGREHATRDKLVSLATLYVRRKLMFLFFSDLDAMGFKLPSIYSFREKHARVLFSKWEDVGISASTLQSRYTCMQLFATWIGKYDMLLPFSHYLRHTLAGKRTYIAIEDKSWDANGVLADDVIVKAMELDQYVGHQLQLIKVFGLRRKEAVCFRPHICYDQDNGVIQVYQGTKGGRFRVLPVRTEEQIGVLHACMKLAKRHSDHMGNPERTLEQNLRRLQYVLERLGITREALGVTAHGLRHEYANNRYQDLTGEPSPLRGGSDKVFLKDETKAARLIVAEELGHSRLRITTAYYGSTRESSTLIEQRQTVAALTEQYLASSPFNQHLGLIECCFSAGLGIAGTVKALALIGVKCTEQELGAWMQELRTRGNK